MKNLRLTTKGVVALMASTLLLGGAIGGTMAWLTAETSEVKNTFTVGDIGDLELEETETETDANGDATKSFQIIPSVDIVKDPKVTYTAEADDVAAYVFVTMTLGNDWSVDEATHKSVTASGLSFSVATDWTYLSENDGTYVYYKEVVAGTAGSFNDAEIIKGSSIEVSDTITKEDLKATTNNAYDELDITFKAYAIQQEGFENAAAAWLEVSGD